ncbi:MAG TPA: peroxide stress protein YaaA [Paludibacter sp.]|nr:peroxide stress protein YaaA [Paludibacter sp.]
MLLLLSPAKIQNFEPQQIVSEYTQPQFMDAAKILIDKIRELSLADLAKLLEINNNLAQLNVDRHFNWQQPFTTKNAKQAVFVFNGEVFHGLDAKTLLPDQLTYLQSHLRILSGLYGVLRPFDLIQPYRLDVSTRLKTDAGNNLYAFWGNKITEALNDAIKTSGSPKVLLNLASGEYMKSINRKLLQAEVIDFDFLQYKNDEYKAIVMYIKKARGMMVRYVIENRIENVEDLKGFNAEGYWFSPQLSTENKLVFTR